MGQWGSRRKTVSALLGVGLAMVGCSPAASQTTTPAVTLSNAGDPVPQAKGGDPVGPLGGEFQAPGLTVQVPAGAVPEGHQFKISLGSPLGRVGKESFGAPVQVEHTVALAKPVRLAWDVSALTAEQRASTVLVRWEPAVGLWRAAREKAVIEGSALVAEVSEFSFLDWIYNSAATVSQAAGQLNGKRADVPKCADGKLPSWITSVVRPDENQPGMPIRTCTEPDKNDVLTVRVANNRPYTQLLDLTQGDKYAWTWAGEQDFTISGIVRNAVNGLMSGDKSLVMAPTRATAVGLSRPAQTGTTQLVMTARPTVATVAEDILVYLLENALPVDNVGGFDVESVNRFVQAVYDCGGKQVLKSRDLAGFDTFERVLETVRTCADNDSVRTAIEEALRAQIAKGGQAQVRAMTTNRGLHSALGKLGIYLKVVDFASYTAELASSGSIGDVKLTVHASGIPAPLGAWKATCSDADGDSSALHKNLASQDAYLTHQSEELSQFPNWKADSVKAAEPLKKCSPSHIEDVARNVESTWGDRKAGAVTAAVVRALAPSQGDVLLHADGLGDFEFGAPESRVLPYLTSVLGKPTIEGGVGGCEAASGGYQSYADFGRLRVRFAAMDDMPTSPRVLASWFVRLTHAKQDHLVVDQSIPFGLSMAQLQAKYPSGGGLEHMDAWYAAGVWLLPATTPGGEEGIQAGPLDWCT